MKSVAAAIDFGTSKVVTLLAESGNFNRCDIIGSGTVPYDGYMNGVWNNAAELPDVIRNSISAAELEGKTRIKEVYVGVPCEYMRVVCETAEAQVAAEDRRVTDQDLLAVEDACAEKLDLAGQAALVIHRSPAWFTVDGGKKTMTPIGLKGQTISGKVAFVLADPSFAEEVTGLLLEQGVGVLGFLAPSMGESMLLLSLEERDRVAVLVDIGYLNTEFSVVEGDAIVYHAVLPMGAGHITADLAGELQIPMKAAEGVKRGYVFLPDEFDTPSDPTVTDENGQKLTFPRSFVQSVMENSTDELIHMLSLALKDCEALLTPRSQIFLTGGGLAMMRGGREYLAKKLERPVKVSAVKTAKLNSPVYASALGLIDLVFDSIEQHAPQDAPFTGKLAGSIRGLFNKK